MIQAVPHFWSDQESCSPSPAAASFILQLLLGCTAPLHEKNTSAIGVDWRVSRAVLGQLLVLTIADSFATLEGRSAAARTAVWSVITQCRAYNVGDCGGLVRMCGVRRVLSPMLQTCLRSTYFLTALQWVAFLVPLWRCSVSLSEAPGTNKNPTLYSYKL